ncbi:MAG: HAMP domain-containing protein, partial [Dehalococcoidia bacterium]
MVSKKRVHNKVSSAGYGHFTPRFSIGVRFIGLIVLVAILTGGVGSFVSVTTSRDSIRESALQSNFAKAKLAAEFASEYMLAIQANIRVFADRPDVRQAVLDNMPEQLQSTLANFVQVQSALESSAVFDSEGIMIVNSVPNASTVGQSFADRAWFQEVVATHQPVQSAPLTSRLTGSASVPYSVPILDEQGQIRGMLNGVITLDKLSDAIVHIDYGNDTRVSIIYILDGGIILAHMDTERIMTPVSGDNEAVNRILAGESGTIETTSSSGELDLIGFAQVPELPWGVMVITPSATALAITNTMTQNTLISTGFIILATGALGAILALGVTRPLRRLVVGITEMGQGNLDYQIATKSKDEVGDLSRAINDMARELKHTLVSRGKLAKEIIERTQAESMLRDISRHQETILETVPDIIMEVDNKKVYTWANKAGIEFFGNDVIGKEAS